MGSATSKCKIEWNDNFEATHLKNCMDWQHKLSNTNFKKMFVSMQKVGTHMKILYCVTEHHVNMAPRHVHTGEKMHA